MTAILPGDQARYSAVAIWLHWLLAAALAFQIGLGFAMPKDASGFSAYQLHKSVGIAILLLTAVRLAWRLAKRPPLPVERGPAALAAKAVHAGFYAVLILGPLTGWLLVSTAPVEVPTVLFGLLPWPHLPVSPGLHGASEQAHEWLSWLAIGLFLLHVAGALRHQVILRHRLLERMAPAGSMRAAGLLSVLVMAVGLATFVLVLPGEGERDQATETSSEAALAEAEAVEAPTALEEDELEPAEEELEPPDLPRPTWTIQPGGRLAFSVANGGDIIRGSFADWSGSIRFDPDDPGDAEIRIDVELSSASVGDVTMDGTLRGEDFLAVGASPRATWRSTSVRGTGAGRYAAQGILTLRGVSHPQALTFTLAGDGLRRSVEGEARINRNAFGVGVGASAETLAGSVELAFAFDAVGRRP